MKYIGVQAEADDAPDFVAQVQALANGILRSYAPPALILIKINNWFSVRWLRFSGKTLGAVGVCSSTLSVPPFVPNRVVSQRRFTAPMYDESGSGRAIHVRVASVQAILRRAADAANGAAMLWYSGRSNQSNRGAVMAYVPVGDTYLPWYTNWATRDKWVLVEHKGISGREVADLIQV